MLVHARAPTGAIMGNVEISLLKSSSGKRMVARVSAHEQSLHKTNVLALFENIYALLKQVLLQEHLL
jgi:hypothetical protein